ncbi:MAG: DUF6262 family protein [Eubacteriales bacterium]
MKKLQKGLENQQEQQREETINKVLHGIQILEEEGQKVTISALMELTGLSRSVFAKEHIRVLLGDKPSRKRKSGKKCNKTMHDDDEKDKIIADLREKNTELEKECEFLRGRLFLLMEKNL